MSLVIARNTLKRIASVVIITAGLVALQMNTAVACPFCGKPAPTLTEDIENSDAAIIARLIEQPDEVDPLKEGAEILPSKFRIEKVLRGEGLQKSEVISAYYYGVGEPGQVYMLLGVNSPHVVWGTPQKLTKTGQTYLPELLDLPVEGPKRLAHFLQYLENPDEMIANDAFDEFAKAPYDDVIKLGPEMDREQLLRWIKSPVTPSSRRRLYFTMLGICGQEEDIKTLEGLLTSSSRRDRTGLDALIACYLKLKGPEGLPLVEDLFLRKKSVEYSDLYSTIQALRFHGNELTIIPTSRISKSFRLILDRPSLADIIIPDLARWEDWESTDRLVEIFKNADDETSWVRESVVRFLMASPEDKAKEKIKELRIIDPKPFELIESGPFGPPPVPEEKAS